MKTAIFYRQGKRKSAKSALPCDESEVELISLTSIVEKKYTMEVNETRNCLVTDILLNIRKIG